MITNDKQNFEIITGGITAPQGFQAAGKHIGIKKAKKDFAVIYSQVPALASGVFTKNIVKAPPLYWCEKLINSGKKIQAIGINSGNANACTGEKGYENAVECAKLLAYSLNISEESVLVTSTGVIGVYLPMDVMRKGIVETAKTISSDRDSAIDCAMAIMTTDTFTKEITVKLDINGVEVKIAGIAKGSGMIHPNMATMLNFITTDVNIEKELLDKAFKSNIDDSFNMITVDGETSTNDMAIILANGCANNEIINKEDENYFKFKNALEFVLKYLAKSIVKDGEGATKMIECHIKGAKNKQDARVLCKAILNSNLVKTAFFGQDANWGRIISAMGATCLDFDPSKAKITFISNNGEITLFENGAPIAFDEDFAFKILSENEIKVIVELKDGDAETIGWGSDLTYDYVKINAEYRS